jgi:hypothetical protein
MCAKHIFGKGPVCIKDSHNATQNTKSTTTKWTKALIVLQRTHTNGQQAHESTYLSGK